MPSPNDAGRAISATRFLPLMVGLLLALTLLPIMAAGYFGARDNTSRLLRLNQDAILDGIEQKLRDALDGVATQMALAARAIADGRADPANREMFSVFMRGVATGQASVVAVSYLEQGGPMRRWPRATLIEDELERDLITDVEAIWPRAQSGTPFWGAPFVSAVLKKGIVPHLQPVVRQGKVIGVIVTAVTWDALADYVGTMEQSTTPFVLVGLDRVIVHPNIAQVMTPTGTLPKLGDVGDNHLARIWTDQQRPAFGTQAPRSQTHWSWTGEGRLQARQYSYRTIEGYGTDHWIVGFHQDSRATMRERWIVQSLLYGSGLLLLIGTLASWGLARRAVQPAAEIAEAARALERLDFDAVARPALVGSRLKEVRDTSGALIRAAHALKRFQTYVPRTLVGQLMEMGGDATAASDREVTVLFMDLAGYSGFSEGRSATEVAAYLNRIFARVGPIIERHGGSIDKYTGDGLMAVWGAPSPVTAHAQKAIAAASEIVEALSGTVLADLAADPRSCRIRLGLHTGRVLAGDLGFAGRTDYTVVGKTVNIAQRAQAALKSVADKLPVELAMTEATRLAAGLPGEGLERLPDTPGGETVYRL
jgi:adenylate cyclase